jgi:tetratricopeptide (TPR) repeat protein
LLAMAAMAAMAANEPGNSQLVGREAALARLHAARALDSARRVVLVVGPAGIGKTSLLHEFRTRAAADGTQVGWGVAGEWEGTPGLWPWYEALCDIDADQDIISLGTDAAPASPDMAELFRAVARWLADRGATSPVVLVTEDLHEADPTAVALFAYLARRPAMPGVTVIASTRPGNETIDSLRCGRITLDGLSPAHIIELGHALDVAVDESAADELARRTNGNPLFVQRLLESGAAGPDGAIPTDVAALLRQQLDDAPADAQPALRALAVLGSAPVDVLQRMTTESPVGPALSRVSGDVLSIADGSSSSLDSARIVAFRHSLFREVMYHDLPADERFALHSRAAAVLRSVDASPIALAHHLSRAASNHRGRDAADAARQAARIERSSGAIREAVHHFGLAVELLGDLGDANELAEAKIELAEALAQLGRAAEAEQRLIEVADSVADHTPDRRRHLVRTYGRLRWLEEPNPSILDSARLVDIAERWLEPESDPNDAAVFHTAIATAGDIRGAGMDDVMAADAAVEAAADTGDPVLIAEALLSRRRALSVHPQRMRERRADADEALRLATQIGDHELLIRAQRLALADALAAADRERVVSLLASDPLSVAGRVQQALAHATLAALEGRYEDADDILDETLKELGYLDIAAPALEFLRISYSWDRGELSETLAIYEPLLPTIADPALRAAVALAKTLSGQNDVAATLVDETLGILRSGQPTVLWTLSMAMVAESAAAIDHPATADIYELLKPFAGECAIPATSAAAWCGAFDRSLGLLSLRLGNSARAADHLRASIVIHERMRANPWIARSRAALAVALDRMGDRAGASEQRQIATEIAESVGMPPEVLLMGDFDTSIDASAASAPSPARTADAAVLVRDGDVWRVGAGEQLHLVRHSNGLDYLQVLIRNAGRDWHALDLYTTVAGSPGVAESGVGPTLDDEARRAYQARYVDLTDALEEATAHADLGTAEAAQREIDELERELLSAFGLGGRARSAGDSTEKARINVRRAISRAIERIAESSPGLAGHLERSIRTGRFCRYDAGQNPRFRWSLESPPARG